MSEKICKICKCIKKNGVRFYNAPEEEKVRNSWSAACGVTITEASMVCQKHFNEKDFHGRKQTLKADALPMRNILETAGVGIAETISTQIKTEPPEFVNVIASNALLMDEEPRIKEEPIDAFQSLAFIDENCFDEPTDNPIGTTDDGNNTTSTNTLGNKILACGRIIVEIEKNGNRNFKLACNYCKSAIPTSEENFFQHFTAHLTIMHDAELQPSAECRKIDSCNLDAEVQTNEITVVIKDKENEKIDIPSEISHENYPANEEAGSKDSDIESDDGARKMNDPQSAESSGDDSDSLDETYEPKPKKMKKALQWTDFGKNAELVISFDHPDKSCVVTFLELLKENSILWLPRQSIMKLFDQALTDVTAKFNEQFSNYSVSKEQLRKSIKRIKEIYFRSSGENHKRRTKTSMYKAKYPEYFELCSAIDENSKSIKQNCDLCRAFFYTPIDMQIHKVKRHRVGELPFKCQHCHYGFTCPKKLEVHEQRHNRVKQFICEYCNQGFYLESKLQAHLTLHTDDSKKICEICGKKFPSLSKYRRHKLHHEEPKEKCKICGKLYFEKWTLSEHMKSHLNERHYKCDICGKKFNRREGVTIHKRGVHKIKTQTKRYVWVNRVTNTSNNETASQNRDLIENEEQNSNSNSSTISSTINSQTNVEVKPVITGNPNHALFPLEILNSLLNC